MRSRPPPSSDRPPLRGALASCALLAACGEPPRCEGSEPAENVLIIISDDVGIDKTASYGEHPDAPPTPALDALAAEGLLFRNAYATPTCSPTRAALLTGRYPSRSGVGRWIEPSEDTGDLPLSEQTIPEMLRLAPRCTTSALMGKWHLVSFLREDPALHPLEQGFDHHAGSLANLKNAVRDTRRELTHERWEKATDGDLSWSDTFSATDTTDEALSFAATAPEPWFLVASYNLAHTPLAAPPPELDLLSLDASASEQTVYEAMVMALDAEIGRLLDGIPAERRARTTVIYLSDNGTPSDQVLPPWTAGRSKGSIYDGGVRVPLLVASPRLATPGAETEALVHVVDIFPTVAEIAGVDTATLDQRLDGVSLLPLLDEPEATVRETVFTESFYPNGTGGREVRSRMLRDRDHKLTRVAREGALPAERLYRYDPERVDEGYDLLAKELSSEDAAAYARLAAELDALEAELDAGD